MCDILGFLKQCASFRTEASDPIWGLPRGGEDGGGGGAGARTCVHLLLHPPLSLDCQACFLHQAQEDFH